MGLTIHHVGCLVADIPEAIAAHRGVLPLDGRPKPVAVSSQKVRVVFLPVGNGTFLEFVQPDPDNSFLLRMLGKGITYYHVGYLCTDIEKSVKSFIKAGAHELNRFNSEAFEGRLCVFLITASQQIVELIEST
jgi:hypothetical protein